jgi:hypothetical protein
MKLIRDENLLIFAISTKFKGKFFRRRDWPPGMMLFGEKDGTYSVHGANKDAPITKSLVSDLMMSFIGPERIELVEK